MYTRRHIHTHTFPRRARRPSRTCASGPRSWRSDPDWPLIGPIRSDPDPIPIIGFTLSYTQIFLIWGRRTIIIKHHILKHHIPELRKHIICCFFQGWLFQRINYTSMNLFQGILRPDPDWHITLLSTDSYWFIHQLICLCVYTSIWLCVYMHIYIYYNISLYIYIERERDVYIYIYIYTYIHTYTYCLFMYRACASVPRARRPDPDWHHMCCFFG